jgi:hypothetical protein
MKPEAWFAVWVLWCGSSSSSWAAPAELAPAAAAPEITTRPSIYVAEFTSPGDQELARTVGRLIAVELDERGYEVVTTGDLRAAAGVEAAKQSLGCDDSDASSCLAELATAVGADVICYGDVTRLNTQVLVTLNFFDAAAARSRGRQSVRVTNLDELPEALADAIARVLPSTRPPSTTAEAAAPATLRAPVVVTSAGAVLVVGASLGLAAIWAINGDKDSARATKDLAIASYPWAFATAATGVVVTAAGAAWWVIE